MVVDKEIFVNIPLEATPIVTLPENCRVLSMDELVPIRKAFVQMVP